MKQGLVQKTIWRYAKGCLDKHSSDILAREEPLEIFLDDLPYSLTMRLPGDDPALVQGLLFSAGIIDSAEQVAKMTTCADNANRIHVALRTAQVSGEKNTVIHEEKRSYARHLSLSSCGVCGKLGLEEFFLDIPSLSEFDPLSCKMLFQAKNDLESRMDMFFRTGCVHAVAIFSRGGELLAFGEDIGRHNAFDKCLGKILSAQCRQEAYLAVCSSRLSLEMVQKAARLGVQVLAGMSAATSLAVHLAWEWKMTLVGFLRQNRFNIYSWPERVQGLEEAAS